MQKTFRYIILILSWLTLSPLYYYLSKRWGIGRKLVRLVLLLISPLFGYLYLYLFIVALCAWGEIDRYFMYSDSEDISRITEVNFPEFSTKHYYPDNPSFTGDFSNFRVIEFDNVPSDVFYHELDSLCNLPDSYWKKKGNAYQYTFYVPHDVKGLCKLMGGKKPFIDKLQMVFDEGLYDPANEPDISYAYIFSNFKGEEWRTDKEVKRLLAEYFRNEPDGIPGNDDTGTMSAWAIFNMLGFYPDCPGKASYTLVAPTFDKVVLSLDKRFWPNETITLVTEKESEDASTLKYIELDGKRKNGRILTHEELVGSKVITFVLE